MNHYQTTAHSEAANTARGTRNVRSAVVMLALIAEFFLLREHWSHIAGYWPYLLLLACPLVHLFHGHGGHGSPKWFERKVRAHAARLESPRIPAGTNPA